MAGRDDIADTERGVADNRNVEEIQSGPTVNTGEGADRQHVRCQPQGASVQRNLHGMHAEQGQHTLEDASVGTELRFGTKPG